VSLSRLIREAAIYAILTGTERIDKRVLENIELDHAAVRDAAEAKRKTRQGNENQKKK
jgi:hypothetical protein